jgi:hypothetical protein
MPNSEENTFNWGKVPTARVYEQINENTCSAKALDFFT